ncbi:hypothetical protein MT325_m769R [Paramecium bursaria chlorella virus MT325]|uniref:Uncharacterized protein m769R n=1 Tax=Paramecium bursaria Chlorella virus MT325 TaxID=346932 RepID=A7IVE9_PBCVM|nr:hypothetical protein MT325_m769R [Paramecium bursaria chlorella virus MT325]
MRENHPCTRVLLKLSWHAKTILRRKHYTNTEHTAVKYTFVSIYAIYNVKEIYGCFSTEIQETRQILSANV